MRHSRHGARDLARRRAQQPITHCDSRRPPGRLALATRGGRCALSEFCSQRAARHRRQSTLERTVVSMRQAAMVDRSCSHRPALLRGVHFGVMVDGDGRPCWHSLLRSQQCHVIPDRDIRHLGPVGGFGRARASRGGLAANAHERWVLKRMGEG
jgi:hypothetical protein